MDIIATKYIDECLMNAAAATGVNRINSGDYRQVRVQTAPYPPAKPPRYNVGNNASFIPYRRYLPLCYDIAAGLDVINLAPGACKRLLLVGIPGDYADYQSATLIRISSSLCYNKKMPAFFISFFCRW